MATEKSINSEVFIEFLKRLISNAKRPKFLILDNSAVHRPKEVLDFVKGTKGKQ